MGLALEIEIQVITRSIYFRIIARMCPIKHKQMMLMKLPSFIAELESVLVHRHDRGRWWLTLDGLPAWCADYPYGLCIACAIEREAFDDAWLAQVSLWLASVRGNLDDSLLLEDNRLWLTRRYAPQPESATGQTQLNQQLAIVRWLANQGASKSEPTEVTGRWV